MYKRILMPTDGSKCSEKALAEGLEFAKALHADVTFLYALEDLATHYAVPGGFYLANYYQDMKKAAQDALQRATKLAIEAGVNSTQVLAERRNPIEAIHEAEQDHDLVIMGTHGRRGFNRFMLGSVAEALIRRSKTPYLLLRHPEPEQG